MATEFDVWCGLDVGKLSHHACALDQQGQRLFDGMLWVSKADFGIVRAEGQAVPQILSTRQENLFPRFTTIRRKVDGKHWFPVFTFADDVLPFRNGPQRERLRIRYSEYKKFGAESSVTFEEPK